MAETHKTRETITERTITSPLPVRNYIFGIYREKGKIVVRKFEEVNGIRICLDEEYALNEDDAIVIMNIMYHKSNQLSLN